MYGGKGMFFGTKSWFKILYFITAMSPAYILYSLHLYARDEICIFVLSGYKIPVITLILVKLFLLLGLIMRKILIRVTKDNENPYHLNHSYREIIDQNGTSLVFLLGVIIPSVIYIENSLTINLIIFLFIQYLLYTLMSNSTTLFPNIVLIIYGIHSFRLRDGKYLVSDKPMMQYSERELQTTIIGDKSNTLCYVKGR